jgi:hypothetical protein
LLLRTTAAIQARSFEYQILVSHFPLIQPSRAQRFRYLQFRSAIQRHRVSSDFIAAFSEHSRACLWRIPKSSGDWSFIQASTVRPPAVRIEAYR